MSATAGKFDIHAHVTGAIVAALEAGTPPWRCPWREDGGAAGLPLRATGEAYRGVNVLVLWTAQARHRYRARHWMTCRQASGLGGQVRRGERSVTVVKVGTFRRSGGDGDGDRGDGSDAPGTRRHARAYRVFNADQIDGLPARFHAPQAPLRDLGTAADPAVMDWFAATGLRLETRDRGEAFYDMAGDVVVMPRAAAFESAHAHGATLAHEACHATGHPERLARDMSNARASYAREELVAELGACLVCAHLGVRPDHGQAAACVAGWLKALRCDRHEIFRAAAAAQAACDRLLAAARRGGWSGGADGPGGGEDTACGGAGTLAGEDA